MSKKIFRKFRILKYIIFFVAFLYILGFFIFYYIAFKPVNPKIYDLGIVLTGEENRISKGLDFYQKGLIRNLFVSGVYDEFPIKYFYNKIEGVKIKFDELNIDNVNFDNKSVNTMENFIFIKKYLQEKKDVKNIMIITSRYHIPRSEFLAYYYLPKGIEVDLYPVDSNKSKPMTFFREYNKTLIYALWAITGVENEHFNAKELAK